MTVRKFETGATRSPLGDKLRYEGFFNPLVLKRYAEYMHRHRFQSDGQVREPDNWQKGMPRKSYVDSGLRHAWDWWLHDRGYKSEATESLEDSLYALMFNVMGYILELEKEKNAVRDALKAESHVRNWVATQPASTPSVCSYTREPDRY